MLWLSELMNLKQTKRPGEKRYQFHFEIQVEVGELHDLYGIEVYGHYLFFVTYIHSYFIETPFNRAFSAFHFD